MLLLTKKIIYSISRYWLLFGIVFLVVFSVVSLRGNTVETVLQPKNNLATTHLAIDTVAPVTKHIETPESTRAIYMSACVAATPSFRDSVVKLINETEINAVMIDVKDFSGTISFDSGLAGDAGSGCRVFDLPEFIQSLHEQGIYTIARITVFQDPFYAKLHPELAVRKKSDQNMVWADRKGINFIEVGARPYWEYIVNVANASHEIGFDEINFDYIRFPSDGNMEDIYFPFSSQLISAYPSEWRAVALERFFIFLKGEMDKINVVTSADLFGMTTTATHGFDLNIGQVLERALPYFDYVAPMVYPSHYPENFNGWADPNENPGELIQYVMKGGVDKVLTYKNATTTPFEIAERISTDQLRPWLQDFDYGGNYDIAEVRAQIDATYAAGLDSWMLWASSNRYTRGALKSE